MTLAGDDLEARAVERLDGLGGHPLDARERRRLRAHALEERRDGAGRALDLEHDAALVVADEAAERELLGQPEDERAEADSLHRAIDADAGAAALSRRDAHVASTSSRSTCDALACASWMRGMCSERVTITWSASASARIRPPS